MRWLIQDIYHGDTKLSEAIKSLGLEVEMLSVKDIYTKDFSKPEYDKVCIHATIEGTKHLVNNFGFKHFSPFKELRCQVYYAYMGDLLFNNHYWMGPLKYAIDNFMFLEMTFGRSLFFRPDENTKIFDGAVYSQEDLKRLIDGAGLPPETLIVCAPASGITREYRVVMHNGRFITGSIYKESGDIIYKRAEDPELVAFCESIPLYPGLPSVYGLDIAEIDDGQKFVLEVSSVNCMGLYDCDYDKVVELMTQEMELAYAADL
jgi:hypothetical protein